MLSKLVNDDLREHIYKELANQVIDSLQQAKTSKEDAQDSAVFVLDGINKAKTVEDILSFLQELAKKWPIYNPVYLKLKEALEKNQTLDKIEEIKTKLDNYIN